MQFIFLKVIQFSSLILEGESPWQLWQKARHQSDRNAESKAGRHGTITEAEGS